MKKSFSLVLHLFVIPLFALSANDLSSAEGPDLQMTHETNSNLELNGFDSLMERRKIIKKKKKGCCHNRPSPNGATGAFAPIYLSVRGNEQSEVSIDPLKPAPTNIPFDLDLLPAVGITADSNRENFTVSEAGIYSISWTLNTIEGGDNNVLSLFLNPNQLLIGSKSYAENERDILSGDITLSLQAGESVGLQAMIFLGTGAVKINERTLSITKVAPAR